MGLHRICCFCCCLKYKNWCKSAFNRREAHASSGKRCRHLKDWPWRMLSDIDISCGAQRVAEAWSQTHRRLTEKHKHIIINLCTFILHWVQYCDFHWQHEQGNCLDVLQNNAIYTMIYIYCTQRATLSVGATGS